MLKKERGVEEGEGEGVREGEGEGVEEGEEGVREVPVS